MLYAFIIIAICSVLYHIFIVKKITSRNIKKKTQATENEPQDFILNSDIWLKPPVELRIFIDKNKDNAIKFLNRKLSDAAIQVRKHAAFVLGQIGDESITEIFTIWLKREPEQCVKDVLEACYTAIKLAPSEKGYTEYQRSLIIDNLLKKLPK